MSQISSTRAPQSGYAYQIHNQRCNWSYSQLAIGNLKAFRSLAITAYNPNYQHAAVGSQRTNIWLISRARGNTLLTWKNRLELYSTLLHVHLFDLVVRVRARFARLRRTEAFVSPGQRSPHRAFGNAASIR